MKRKQSSNSPKTPKTPKKSKKFEKKIPPSTQIKERAKKISEQLQNLFPNPKIPLDHNSNFQLLVAVALSAQTTDKKVNEVTPKLFKIAPDANSMEKLSAEEIEKIIQGVGLGPTKSKNVLKMSQQLVEEFDGEVPDTLEELEKLAGVGRKTASVVMCQAFGKAAFPVDTHIHRLAQRWGLTQQNASVKQTEEDLKLVFEENLWCTVHLQMIYAGREYCTAKKHEVEQCPICNWIENDKNKNSEKINIENNEQNDQKDNNQENISFGQNSSVKEEENLDTDVEDGSLQQNEKLE